MCVYIGPTVYIYVYIYSGASVPEHPCSRTIQLRDKFSEQKMSRMTNGVSDYEHAGWQQWQAESISAGVRCWLTLAQYTSLLDFSLRTFRFTNCLHERIKFVNRDPTVYIYIYMDLCLATLKVVSFYLLHGVSTLNQCRKLSCGTTVPQDNFLCFASYQGYPNNRWDLIWYAKG
jgi:hypothetical protein